MKTLALTLALAAWAHAADPVPDWVNGSSRKYPREQYLVGVGMGDEPASAQDRARGEVSRVFSTVVNVNTSVMETEQNTASGKKTDTSFAQTISQNVQTVSHKLLEGVEVVETWQDKKASRYYALAVLDRAKGLISVKDKMADFDTQAEQWKKQMEQASEKLAKVRAATKLMAILKAREDLNCELRVLDPGGKGSPGPINESMVRPQAAKILSDLEVYVDIKGDGAQDVLTGVVKGLNSFGLEAQAGSAGPGADILVEGSIETKALPGDNSRWRWARSTVTVSLKDGKSGKIFLRFEASERQAAGDQREAARRSVLKLSKKVAGQINEAITRYFENQ